MTLADYLEAHGMTDAAFAALVNVNQSTVNRIRRGQKPSPAVIEVIAVATNGNVLPNDFFQVSAKSTRRPLRTRRDN